MHGGNQTDSYDEDSEEDYSGNEDVIEIRIASNIDTSSTITDTSSTSATNMNGKNSNSYSS